MKKDIIIPEISGVEMAVVFEYNGIYNTNDWNVYLINNNDAHLEMVVIVSKGFGNKKVSSVMRKKIDVLVKTIGVHVKPSKMLIAGLMIIY